MTPRLPLTIASLLAAGTLLLCPAASASVTLDDGHVDYGARIVGGDLQSRIKDGTGASVVWREPSEVVFALGPQAIVTVPSGFGFLGPPGTRVWMIPQVQRPGVLWAGWNTEEVGPDQVSSAVTWRLDKVEGPGRVAVFQTGAFGTSDVIFDSGDGLPDTRAVPLGTHAHGNWAFSAAGEYRLTFTMSATRAEGGSTSDTEVLTVRTANGEAPPPAGGEPPSGESTGGGSTAGGKQTEAGKASLRVFAVRLRGRRLALSVKLGRRGQVDVALHRAGRRVARTPTRRVGERGRRLRFRLRRRLGPGRYRLVVRARSGSTRLRRTVAVQVDRPGGRADRRIATWRLAR